MKKGPAQLVRYAACLLLLCLMAGCSKLQIKRHLYNADRYYSEGDYEKAKLEYVNALRFGAQNERIFVRLGTMWLEQGAPLRAGPFLYRALQAAPTDAEARIKFVRAYILVGGLGEAHTQAMKALQDAPANGEALFLAAETSLNPNDVATLPSLLAVFPDKQSIYYHLAAGDLALRQGNVVGAQAEFQQAMQADSKSPYPHNAMALVYYSQKNNDKMAEELKASAELASPHSTERMRYAEYLAASGKQDEAAAWAKQITKEAPDYLPAWRLLGQLALAQKKYQEGVALVSNGLSIDQDNADLLMLDAELRLELNQPAKAIDDLQRVDKVFPNNPATKLQLARAYLGNNDLPTAASVLSDAITANPNFNDGILMLADITLRMGDYMSVTRSMEAFLKKQPQNARAESLLAQAYQSLNRLDEAVAIYEAQIKTTPQNPQPYVALAGVLRQQKQLGRARAALQVALGLSPTPFIAEQLVDLDIEMNDLPDALSVVDRQLFIAPDSAPLHAIRGKVLAAQKDFEQSAAEFSKALELDPSLAPAYDGLVAAYIGNNQLAEAAKKLEDRISRSTPDPSALMTLALVYEKLNDWPKAKDNYEKLLTLRPDYGPALNNLAYIYSEKLPQLDRAAELARRARAQQPNEPAYTDTLAWTLYKQGDYQQAMALLQDAAAKLPNVADIQFHLGMASYMMGQTDAARTALQKALDLHVDFQGKDEAQKRLAEIARGVAAPSTAPNQKGAEQAAGDVVGLLRSADEYEKQGDAKKAAEALQQVVKLNPKLAAPNLKLAQLYTGPLAVNNKALEFAKKARELAPSDAETGAVLGRIAYDAGNWSWSAGLLQDAARRLPDNAIVQHDYAWAAYSLGKVPEAEQAMKRAADLAPETKEGGDAKTFLAMIEAERGTDVEQDAAGADKVLASSPDYVPALVVKAKAARLRGQTKLAEETYNRVLQRFPEFAPAQRDLAAVYAMDPQNNSKAYDLVSKARKTLSDDAELSRVIGIVSYQRKDYIQAAQALQQSGRKKPLDAESMFYLGMSQLNTKQEGQGKHTLEQALAAGLDGPHAEEARGVVERK